MPLLVQITGTAMWRKALAEAQPGGDAPPAVTNRASAPVHQMMLPTSFLTIRSRARSATAAIVMDGLQAPVLPG